MGENLRDGVEEDFNHGLTDLDFEHIQLFPLSYHSIYLALWGQPPV